MGKCKSLKNIVIILSITALMFSSCARNGDAQNVDNDSVAPATTATEDAGEPVTTPIIEEPSASPIVEEPSAPPEVDNNIDAFTNLSYMIAEEVFEDGDIRIKYPRITGLKDTGIEDKINELIKNDAMIYVAEYSSEGAALDVNFEIAWAGENLLSIKFIVYSNYPEAAHPNHSFYSTNIYIPMASKIMLTE